MPLSEPISSSLYSRQQVARLTGIDDSTLNYWMREGVLRAAEGGTGKGQHRRFRYHQINLALLLDQLRGFGVALPALKRLADRFHVAIDHYERIGIDRENDDAVGTIIYFRQQFERQGFVRESVEEEKLAKYIEIFPWIALKSLQRSHKHLPYEFEATVDEAIAINRCIHLVYDREPDPVRAVSDDLVDLAKSVDIKAWYSARPYWSAITWIAPDWEVEVNERYYTPLIVYRNADGEWEVCNGDPSSSMLSYVGVYLEKLSKEAWAKLANGDQA